MTKPYQMRISKLEIVVNENKQKINLTSRTMYQKNEHLYDKVNYNHRFSIVIMLDS